MKKIFLFIALIFCFYNINAQNERRGNIGISASVQSAQFGIIVPYWVTNKISVAPAFDLKFAEKIGTDMSFGIIPRFYFSSKNLSPYMGLKFGLASLIPSTKNNVKGENSIDLIFGFAFGGEYFFNENFSAGVELQGNITKSGENSSRFGNPDGINFNTASMVSVSVYF